MKSLEQMMARNSNSTNCVHQGDQWLVAAKLAESVQLFAETLALINTSKSDGRSQCAIVTVFEIIKSVQINRLQFIQLPLNWASD